MSEESRPDPLPFSEREEKNAAPSEENVLRHLSQTLSVTKTLKRFSSLTPKNLQEIFRRSADRARDDRKPPPGALSPGEAPEFFIHADGASRGNPGEAGAGAVLSDSRGRTLKELKSFLGIASNNTAEYQAAILALEKALELGAGRVTVSLDSELVVRQLRGEYQVREPHLRALHQKAQEILKRFTEYRILYIPRQENRRADQLANEAIDQKNG